MRMPWSNKVGLAKVVAIVATILLVSLGLCGINFVAAIGLASQGARIVSAGWLQEFFLIAGLIESVAIVVSAIALVAVFLFREFQAVWRHFHSGKGE